MSTAAKSPLRQGDILIIPVNRRQVPKGLVPVDRDQRKRLVLAEGETTGHCHAILDDPAILFRQADMDELADRFLKVDQEVEVVHEEHGTIALRKGDYIIRHKREYSPAEIRRVVD